MKGALQFALSSIGRALSTPLPLFSCHFDFVIHGASAFLFPFVLAHRDDFQKEHVPNCKPLVPFGIWLCVRFLFSIFILIYCTLTEYAIMASSYPTLSHLLFLSHPPMRRTMFWRGSNSSMAHSKAYEAMTRANIIALRCTLQEMSQDPETTMPRSYQLWWK